MRFVHRLVRQHRLADDVANGEDVGHVGTHLDIDLDQVAGRLAGSAQAFEDSMRDFPMLLLVTLLLIDMILAILYEHFIHPITILPSLPLAGFGLRPMLWLFRQELNLFSFLGVILLVGLLKKTAS